MVASEALRFIYLLHFNYFIFNYNLNSYMWLVAIMVDSTALEFLGWGLCGQTPRGVGGTLN